jgi:hypothetical protein
VTGGSKGLGKAMARALAKAGASVAISSRHEDELKSAAAEIGQETHAKVVPLTADMTHRGEVKGLAERAIAALGKVDKKSAHLVLQMRTKTPIECRSRVGFRGKFHSDFQVRQRASVPHSYRR